MFAMVCIEHSLNRLHREDIFGRTDISSRVGDLSRRTGTCSKSDISIRACLISSRTGISIYSIGISITSHITSHTHAVLE